MRRFDEAVERFCASHSLHQQKAAAADVIEAAIEQGPTDLWHQANVEEAVALYVRNAKCDPHGTAWLVKALSNAERALVDRTEVSPTVSPQVQGYSAEELLMKLRMARPAFAMTPSDPPSLP